MPLFLPLVLRLLAAIVSLGTLSACRSAVATPLAESLTVDTVATGLGRPMAMAFIAPGTALVGSVDGTVSRLDVRTGRHTALQGTPRPLVSREAGLLDLVLDPGHATNGRVYLTVVVGEVKRNVLTVIRGRIDGDSMVDTTTILTAAMDTTVDHYGGRMAFGDGHLFVTVGDRYFSREGAQDLGSLHGKILRINPDGTVPVDNPFVGRPGARPEVWSYGHRNIKGIAVDPVTGTLWANEMGPRHGDEMNRIEPGRDYGWPRVSFGWEYEGGPIGKGVPVDTATPAPEWVWSPSIAPHGLHVYQGDAFPAWRGSLLSGAMHVRRLHLNRLVWDGERFVTEERLLPDRLYRVRFVTEDSRGLLYVGNDSGVVYRVSPGYQVPLSMSSMGRR